MPLLIPILIGGGALATGFFGGVSVAEAEVKKKGTNLLMAAAVIGGLYLLTRKR